MGSRGREVAHVDDTSRIDIAFTVFSTVVCSCSKEGQAFLGESEHSVKVQRQDFGPSLVLSTTTGSQSPSKKLEH